MKILVTGGAGFIGSHIVDQCIAAGHQVAVVDNLWEEGGGKNTNLNPQARFFRVDITDEDSLNKMVAEHYLRYWKEAYGLAYTAPRYGNVYGPRQDPNGEAGVIAIFAKRFLNQETIRIDWDGEQQKDYVYVEDVARANLIAMEPGYGDNDIFCIATGKGTSVNEIYNLLAAQIGYQPEIVRAPRRPGDIHLTYFDCNKAARILGWKPTVDIEQGIRATVEHFKMVE